MKRIYILFLVLITLQLELIQNVYAQNQGVKVSYPSGKRLLVKNSLCTNPEWKMDSSSIEYVQITTHATFCQQFNEYLIPSKSEGNEKQTLTWGKKGPEKGAIFLGSHFELINEKEVFVQLLSSDYSRQELEDEVKDQCLEWVKLLPKIESSEKLPSECKNL